MPLVVDPDGVELETIRGLVELRGKRVVDVGCGEGRLSFACAEAGADVFAFDPDEESIEVARSRAASGVRFEVGDAAEFDLPRRKFDLALFSWSL